MIENCHTLARRHILVVVVNFTNAHSRCPHLDFEFPTLSKFLEFLSADVRNDITEIINELNMTN